MRINSFKIDGRYTVGFEDGNNEIRLSTPDRPETELFQAMAAFLRTAYGYFGNVTEGVFYSIAITGTNDPQSRLVIEIPTNIMGENARVSFPPVSSGTVFDKNMEPDQDHPRNKYNGALSLFIEQVKAYTSGKRSQIEFSFEDEDVELEVADKITRFPKVAQ
jgi:hypothetical protein